MINHVTASYHSNFTAASQPIGVLDSGVGGITVLKHIHALLPQESLIYFADSLHAPYGSKTVEAIQARCIEIAEFLLKQQVKAIVVACNTATAAAIDMLRERYPHLPIIGMEPAVKPAAAASHNGIIGVLATVGTLKSAQFAALLENYGRNVEVVTQGCVGLVECIERGELDHPATDALLQSYCAPLLAEGADTIVLGCTHYPFVKDSIQHIVGPEVTLIDTGEAVARQLQHRLEALNLLNHSRASLATVDFYTNSTANQAEQILRQLWGKAAHVTRLNDTEALQQN